MHDHLEQQPQGIDEHMALASEDFLGSIEPTRPTLVRPDGS